MAEKDKIADKEKKSANGGEAAEAGGAAARLDQLIDGVERVYESLTGTRPPAGEGAYAPIPVEQHPAEFVGERLERLLAALQQPTASAETRWSPALSVWEDDKQLLVCVDLAGVRRDEVAVAVEGRRLIVRGSRPASDDGKRLVLSERPLGSFQREILLPQRADLAEPEAHLEDGVLEIRVPKIPTPATERRKVRVA